MISLVFGALVVLIVTTIVTESFLFTWLRQMTAWANKHLGYLFSCFLCFGTWVGLMVGYLLDGPFHPALNGLAYHGLAYLTWVGLQLVNDLRIRIQR